MFSLPIRPFRNSTTGRMWELIVRAVLLKRLAPDLPRTTLPVVRSDHRLREGVPMALRSTGPPPARNLSGALLRLVRLGVNDDVNERG
jgi:hypothetical protein